MKTLVFGIDGASFELMNRFMEEGLLPTFQMLKERGAYGKLDSTIPPHTAPGWMSAFSGVNAGEHGIYQFWDTQSDTYVGKFMGSVDMGVPAVWEILNQAGKKTGVVNVPMTHPIKKLDGFMISWPLSNTLHYCYPEKLLAEIAKHGGHYVNDLIVMCDGNIDYIDKAIEITKKRVKTLEYLVHNYNWDFIAAVFTEIDRVSHFFWHYMDAKSPEYQSCAAENLRNAIQNIYIETDKALAEILKFLPKETNLIVLSDHGFGVGYVDFYVQTFLKKKGFLHTMLVTKAEEALRKINEGSWFEYEQEGERHTVNWNETVAYMSAPGSYGININLKNRQKYGIVSEEEYESVRDKLIEELSQVINPASGCKLFEKVVRREEVYFGNKVEKAPDLILIPKNYGIMVSHLLKEDEIFGLPEQKGMHRPEGIFFIYNENRKISVDTQESRLEDIAATILNIYGISIPDYMEGQVMCKLNNSVQEFCDLGSIEKKETNTIQGEAYEKGEIDSVKNRLKALGYL